MAGGDRSNADSLLVAALAGGDTVADAAEKAHVAQRTVYRRLEEPAFRDQVAAVRADMVDRVVGALAAASSAAVTTLRELLDPAVAPTVRLGAARAIIDLGSKARDAEDVARRLYELEETVSTLRAAAASFGGTE